MNFRKPFLVLATVLVASGAVWADSFDRHVSDIVILQMKPVQHEIGLTEAQRAKMNQAADAHRTELEAYGQQLEKSKSKPKSQRIIAFYDELKDKVLAQLSPAQVKRLGELSLQKAGVLALGDKVVADRLGVSASQLKQIRAELIVDQKNLANAKKETAEPIAAKYKGKKPKSEAEAKDLEKQFYDEVAVAVRPKLLKIEVADTQKVMKILTHAQELKFYGLQGKRMKKSS